MALGLRYAGSASAQAHAVLLHHAQQLLAAKRTSAAAASMASSQLAGTDRQALESCLDTVVLAMSVVMAGTGHLPTFRLLQQLSKRVEGCAAGSPGAAHPISYGNHMAVGMALGFLFMGGGYRTFSTRTPAVAALLIALLPRWPSTSADNSCHLQVGVGVGLG
jgi:anaphase-promoting complex subunit 1